MQRLKSFKSLVHLTAQWLNSLKSLVHNINKLIKDKTSRI